MKNKSKNISILEYILTYCSEIAQQTWKTITDDIPSLQAYCSDILSQYKMLEKQ